MRSASSPISRPITDARFEDLGFWMRYSASPHDHPQRVTRGDRVSGREHDQGRANLA
jgi:hypothetical protein